ncbi:Arabinanase/levansucrase/invertase [Glarea lozoyensis ATCC 20868]|uniref:Arabinanase/levansucrase/invertase n=1 Tax=Glarea lozoyensis (strain ATCC 20868 / MF5171) TaxID=1116229 RepID=S3CZI6_GLAL2|nr:Arabinanase/levansucrase/invertase [Glarea lozoyensis ATCC 20868]EPE30279.1 Arabinanase/levansucrase/invertase [Glarea lozoyensis ATCC 20868]
MKLSKLFSVSCLAGGALSASWIVPGAVWTDTAGNKIDAHGGNVVQRGDTFYWVGQSASQNEIPLMYSSTDLLNWTPLGAQNSLQYLWRPKIAKPNGSFWIYGQLNRNIQSMVSTQMVGGYKLHGAAVTIPPNGYTYSDTGMFQDTDGSWYILTSADHNIVQINKLNSDGSIGARASQLAAGAYEAPGILKVSGTYYLIVSGKTGWRSNPNKVFSAPSIAGPWTGPSNIAPEAEKTYNSQNTFELTIAGSQATTYIYMGDSWDSKGGPNSNHVWLPIKVDGSKKTLTLDWHAMWKVDVKTGVVSFPKAGRRYEVADAEVIGKRGVVGKVDSESEVVFRNVTGEGGKQWVSFHYAVNNRSAGEAHISINDQQVPTNISSLNSNAGFHNTVPVEIVLEKGDKNVIRFGAMGETGFEVTIDGIEVFDDREEL